MGTVRVDGLDLAYRRSGRGIPLLFLHGAFGDSRDWTAESERLADRADVVAWDAPGCGGSSDVPVGWTDEDWADAIAGFVEALGLDRPVICGLSLGSVPGKAATNCCSIPMTFSPARFRAHRSLRRPTTRSPIWRATT